ncbi:uncharacterized protein DDB_G0283697-like [Belonocnema kinseyi]|uniref:uncharacterized protein DDB_G0283697-like n=1 Tax=Belonocnema kinseyi TaxID=2817044 RepID=UPI00143CFD50|nr:uncharacterized protein DDB_G0283697-like [Belonocnema kinseyi]
MTADDDREETLKQLDITMVEKDISTEPAVYGVRRVGNTLMIGDTPVDFDDQFINVGDQKRRESQEKIEKNNNNEENYNSSSSSSIITKLQKILKQKCDSLRKNMEYHDHDRDDNEKEEGDQQESQEDDDDVDDDDIDYNREEKENSSNGFNKLMFKTYTQPS